MTVEQLLQLLRTEVQAELQANHQLVAEAQPVPGQPPPPANQRSTLDLGPSSQPDIPYLVAPAITRQTATTQGLYAKQ